MKILIVTQKVNVDDDILGFFHGWILDFAKYFESVIVICLEKGRYDLPRNVRVLSLGKENNKSKLDYVSNFYKYIHRERNNYDVVFVHMNEEYVLLGGALWGLWSKKVTMWRNHPKGSFLTTLAVSLCHKVFCTSKFSFTAKYKKTVIMPVGIDTELLKPVPGVERLPKSILFLSRMSPIKKPDLLIKALSKLKDDGVDFVAGFYGNPKPEDNKYYEGLKKMVVDSGLQEKVNFYPGQPHRDVSSIYSKYKIFANLTPSGSYDKTILEAMACGCLIIASNANLKGEIDDKYIFKDGDAADLSAQIKILLQEGEDSKLRDWVNTKHSLNILGDRMAGELQKLKK